MFSLNALARHFHSFSLLALVRRRRIFNEERPLRAELFSADQMAQHGVLLAATHVLGPIEAPDRLLERLKANEAIITAVCQELAAARKVEQRVLPAAEWLLDNFYLVEEEIRTARRHLPRGYSRRLPRLKPDLAMSQKTSLPRVYDLALQVISHGDGQISRSTLSRFITAYQSKQPLLIGELWAIPIMLRLALIENLRRVGALVAASRAEREAASYWVEKMVEVAQTSPTSLVLVIADMARSKPPLTSAFVAEFTRRLQGRGAALALPLNWLEQLLIESGQTTEQLVQMETQQQAANQVSVSNSIGSLRLLNATDWRDFVEAQSGVERILHEDPAGVYRQMDFATRDRYRHMVERLARQSHLDEADVARRAVQMASAGPQAPDANDAKTAPDDRTRHVGFYLIGKGLPEFRAAIGVRQPVLRRVMRRLVPRFFRTPLFLYLGSAFLLTLTLTASPFIRLLEDAPLPEWQLGLIGLIFLLPASQMALTLVNRAVTLVAGPDILPRLDYEQGIPANARTLVVVPTLLGSLRGVEDLAEALEVRFLANRETNLYFGLLTDFYDAPAEHMPQDAALVALATAKINTLNAKYAAAGEEADGDRFFLFHRPRRFNARDNVWMGYERKRGKLAELNALLRGKAGAGVSEKFSHIVGDMRSLHDIRYVITLDTDTQLPRDSAVQLIATMAHPLNQPLFGVGRQSGLVVEGYGILQPRVAVSLPGSNRSRYAQLNGGDAGVDPYTRAVSDVYQDAFGEGSFIGKGIYDIDAFERALGDHLPENRILSHDLLEGTYARAGLVTDVQLVEDPPARYSLDVARRHRWVRGDWQLIAWLRLRLRGLNSKKNINDSSPNPLSLLSRWKIFDNLRRSLVPAGFMCMFVAGWLLLPRPGAWTVGVLAIFALMPLSGYVWSVLRRPVNLALSPDKAGVAMPSGHHAVQTVFALACLPYEAVYSLDAILRTLWRVNVSKRRLLEWRPSNDVPRGAPPGTLQDLMDSMHRMQGGGVVAILIFIGLIVERPDALPVALPLLLLWLLAPVMVWFFDRPPVRRQGRLSAAQMDYLRVVARRTWAFFETYVGPEDNYLPPDNMQEEPVARVAHRTSPTNMGFALLANLTAWDFGYITIGQLLKRSENTLQTMERLEKHNGHFLNWYDTQTLQALRPHYVSTVDSGNLAGYLIVMRAGLLALSDEPIFKSTWFAGVRDTMALLQDALPENGQIKPLAAFGETLANCIANPPVTLESVWIALDDLNRGAAQIVAKVSQNSAAATDQEGEISEALKWALNLASQCRAALDELLFLTPWAIRTEQASSIPTLRQLIRQAADAEQIEAGARAEMRILMIEDLARRFGALANMDHAFLYDETRHLMSIGYSVDDRRLDTGYYDLLASEARLGIFAAIAQGHIPQEGWFALGRLLTSLGGDPILMSWSGSMFEYLMPMLVMPSYENSLLDQTCRAAVQRQIDYGRQRSVPWGISESGYNTTDMALNYQYRAFGAPGLGLKRGLDNDLVIAPYATVMALMVSPVAAYNNLRRLANMGASGTYGFYEAIDYTASRLPRGLNSAVVRSFMVHHLGMSFLSLSYTLLGQPMQKRFVADPQMQSAMLLLQERVPRTTVLREYVTERAEFRSPAEAPQTLIRVINTPDTPAPEVQLLSNGRYHVMVTQAGGGYSRWQNLAVTRWREDATRDNWGSFCYLRDVASGEIWSNAWQPTQAKSDSYEAIFSEGRAEFRRRDFGIDVHTEIAVSPEDDIELRRLHITNKSRTRRVIEVTSYSEVVLAPAAADVQHPAFSKLFVQTEILERPAAVLCTRRARAPEEAAPWMFQLMAIHGAHDGESAAPYISHETDRARFIGRGNSMASPQAMQVIGPLSNTAGSVLDPVAASRCLLTLAPDQTIIVDLVYGMSNTRDQCLAMVEKYQDRRLADRVFEIAWTHGQVVLHQINATEADAQLYGRLASSVIYAQSTLRAESALLIRNRKGQSALWGYAISGDLPIVLLQISDSANIELVRQLVQAHAWWRLKGLAVDLVIWNEERDIYRQRLQDEIMGLIAAGGEANVLDRPGGIFVRHAEHISFEDRVLLQSVARAILSDGRGALLEQTQRRTLPVRRAPTFRPTRIRRTELAPPLGLKPGDLLLFNGTGGFATDGREYIVMPQKGKRPPAPWINVLANPRFGCTISEAGTSYTWCENAHELRLTPWHNDPVMDTGGEAIYLRDEETGDVWSPTSLPAPAAGSGDRPHLTRHGFGYSVFELDEAGLHTELEVFVDLVEAVKFSVLRIRNDSGRPRQISATGYVEWVLGDLQAKGGPHISTEVAPASGAILARNRYSNDYGDWVGFFDVDTTHRTRSTLTGDRMEFIGRNGSLQKPAALNRTHLSGRFGAGLDPCAAIQSRITLIEGQTQEIVFRLGMGRSTDEAEKLIKQFETRDAAYQSLAAVKRHWEKTLGAVQVDTPDPALNVLTNGWLVYQTLACRIWARSGYYQSGGAYGFRDQLQDALSLVHTQPEMLRSHLLLCASRQFIEGDVQHWWHPPQGRGVRTHISDDYLWLPLGVCRYVEATGDRAVLQEQVPFLEGRLVNPQDDSYYDMPAHSSQSGSLYQHAVRAIQNGLRFGAHGLPLMGGGDWNDGMNLVGHAGRGESIWLGFFLYDVLQKFAKLARSEGDTAVAEQCETESAQLQLNLEMHGWDGQWYRRAYFDDGMPLGSSGNIECQIDAIAQSWAVLSGAGNPARAQLGMEALDQRLVRREHGIVQLLDPPFDQKGPNPGYIAGYVPGVRENGGQYTHAAIWAGMAFAALNDHKRAWEIVNLINPVKRAENAQQVAIYKVEPYVMSADVYGVAPHTGRGGWSWYTGSAGWMYRLVVESLLGLRLENDRLYVAPCLPTQWSGFTMRYRHGETFYDIEVTQTGAPGLRVDGVEQADLYIPLVDDQQPHKVSLRYTS